MMNYDGVAELIEPSGSTRVPVVFCEYATTPDFVQGNDRKRIQLDSTVYDHRGEYTFYAYTKSPNQFTIAALELACKSEFDIIHAMVKVPELTHHVQQPPARNQAPIVSVPIKQAVLTAVESNGYPSFRDMKNRRDLKPCHIFYATTNTTLITSHKTRKKLIENGSHSDDKNYSFLKIPNLVPFLEKFDTFHPNYDKNAVFDHHNKVVLLAPVHKEGKKIYFKVMDITQSDKKSYQWYITTAPQCCLSMYALVEREGIAPMRPMAFCPHIFVNGWRVTKLGKWTLSGVLYFYLNPDLIQERFYMNDRNEKVYGRGHLNGADMSLAIPRMKRLLRMNNRLMTVEDGLIDQIENLIERHEPEHATFGIEEEIGEEDSDDEDFDDDDEDCTMN